MSTKIEETLIKLGIEQQNVSEILELVPQIITDFEHNYSVSDLKKVFETLIYIHIAQNIRDEGMWRDERNCPNRDLLDRLVKFGLIDNTYWQNRSIQATDAGEKLSKAIMERKINQNALKEMIKSTPQMIIEIIQNYQLLPIIYPNESYVQNWGEFPQNFLLSLPGYNEKCYNLCKPFYIKALKEGWACIAHSYVATRKGEERGEYYVLSTEIMDAFADVIPHRIPKELEQQINEIKDNMYALKFLFQYNPDAYNGLGKYSQVEENIISYLKELTDTIDSSRDLFTSGFSSQIPFMIRDADAYKTKILKFEKELNKKLSEIFSGTGTQTSIPEAMKEEKTKKPAYEPKEVKPKPSLPISGNEIIIGAKEIPVQWGIIGRTKESRIVKLDLNAPHVVFICGKMGKGKGYDIGVMCEMLASDSIENISSVEKKGTIVVFYDGEPNIPSEFNMINVKNDMKIEIERLNDYGTRPQKLFDDQRMRIFLDPTVYNNYSNSFKQQYELDNIQKIQIDPATLEPEDWALSLSVGDSKALYIDGIFEIIRNLGINECNLENIITGIENSDLSKNQKQLANKRLDIFREFFIEGKDFLDDLIIGGINIFDMRRMMYRPDHIFAIMTLIVSRLENRQKLTDKHGQFPVIFVINEAHKYLDPKKVSSEFIDKFIGLVKRKRHGGNWLIIDTHEPDEVHNKFVTHSDIKIIHQLDISKECPKELKNIIKKSPKEASKLEMGEAIITADSLLDGQSKLQNEPRIVNIRPRITKHGGATKTAIDEK